MFRAYFIPIFLLFLFGGTTVVASAIIAKNFGCRLGRVLATFPVVYLTAILNLSMDI